MTGWKHVDRITEWGRNNPDRVFYLGLGLFLFACLLGF